MSAHNVIATDLDNVAIRTERLRSGYDRIAPGCRTLTVNANMRGVGLAPRRTIATNAAFVVQEAAHGRIHDVIHLC